MSKTRSIRNDIVVSFLGVASTVIVAGILGFIEVEFGLALYSFMFFFIIPFGAILSGFAAASGYFLGARITNLKPSGTVFLIMVCASIMAFFIVKYIPYYFMVLDGVVIREYLSFWKYLDISISNTSLQFSIRGRGVGDAAELGSSWGYAYVTLQVVGFIVGGFAMYGFLSDKPFCDTCSKYMKKTGKQETYTGDGDKLVNDIQTFAGLITDKQYAEGILYHSSEMGCDKYDHKAHHLRTLVEVHECPTCRVNQLDFVASTLKGDDWSDIDGTKIVEFTVDKLIVP